MSLWIRWQILPEGRDTPESSSVFSVICCRHALSGDDNFMTLVPKTSVKPVPGFQPLLFLRDIWLSSQPRNHSLLFIFSQGSSCRLNSNKTSLAYHVGSSVESALETSTWGRKGTEAGWRRGRSWAHVVPINTSSPRALQSCPKL
jgi:hypothetical protein